MVFHTLQRGFTLIEMIVSLAIFSLVATVSVGALLVLVASNQQLQGEQSVMTNLSFALDSMSREIRTGTNYVCVSESSASSLSSVFNNASDLDQVLANTVQDCSNGNPSNLRYHGLALQEGGDSVTATSDRILYFYDSVEKKIYRRIGAEPAESIVSSGIVIEDLKFFVSGAKPQSAGGAGIIDQPAVTLFIKATEQGDATDKPYYLQTTVTQRTLDL